MATDTRNLAALMGLDLLGSRSAPSASSSSGRSNPLDDESLRMQMGREVAALLAWGLDNLSAVPAARAFLERFEGAVQSEEVQPGSEKPRIPNRLVFARWIRGHNQTEFLDLAASVFAEHPHAIKELYAVHLAPLQKQYPDKDTRGIPLEKWLDVAIYEAELEAINRQTEEVRGAGSGVRKITIDNAKVLQTAYETRLEKAGFADRARIRQFGS